MGILIATQLLLRRSEAHAVAIIQPAPQAKACPAKRCSRPAITITYD